MTSQLSAALRAAAAGIHPDEAAAGLIISHGTFLRRGDFAMHIETAAGMSDGTPMAWIGWDAVIAALAGGRLPASGGERRIVQIAASLAAGHPASLGADLVTERSAPSSAAASAIARHCLQLVRRGTRRPDRTGRSGRARARRGLPGRGE